MKEHFKKNNDAKAGWVLISVLAIAPLLALHAVGEEDRQRQSAKGDKDIMSDERLIVGFREGVDRDEREAVHRAVGAKVVREIAFIAADVVILTTRLSIAEAVTTYERNKAVKYAEPDRLQKPLAEKRTRGEAAAETD